MYPAALWSPMTAADHVDVVASSLALRAVLLVALPWPPGAACIEPDVADPDVAPPDDADPLPGEFVEPDDDWPFVPDAPGAAPFGADPPGLPDGGVPVGGCPLGGVPVGACADDDDDPPVVPPCWAFCWVPC